MKYLGLLLSFFLLLFISCNKNKSLNNSPFDLQIEYLKVPLGIDDLQPRFSWKLPVNVYLKKQKAYQILVASNKKNLENNLGDLWDLGKVISDQSTHIKYVGDDLKSRQKVFWKVKFWNQDDQASEWSEIASWEMGLLKPSDWQAKWIGTKELENNKMGKKNPTLYFRKEFVVKDNFKNARVYISGLGYYELYINGKKVGDHVLSPNQTNYDKRQVAIFDDKKIANMSTRVLYETFDISSYLNKGENTVAVILGNGWYYRSERDEYLPLSYDLPRFISQIELDLENGNKQKLVSDGSWKLSKGPIIENSIYYGEVYDARLEQLGWNNNGFDDSKWDKSKIVRSPEGDLKAQMSPPDRVTGTIKPVSIKRLENNKYRYDFGTMFSGWVKLKVKGKSGNKLKLTFLEDNDNTYEQTDTYILKGEEEEIWEPKFTWHAFRYVDVSSPDIALTLDNLEGKIVHTDVNSAGKFESSNKLFNTILSDFKETQLDNMHGGLPSDCPHRERRGYTGDGQIAAQAAIYSLDMKSFYTKWIKDIADSQNSKTGYVPYTAPYQSGGGGTPWGSAYIIIPWYMYLYYGDISVLEEHYEGMKLYLSFLQNLIDDDGLIKENYLGEWVPPTETKIPPSFVSSAYYYYDLSLMDKIASVLNKEVDATNFIEKGKGLKEAFNKRYYNTENSSYSIGWQGANVFPLAFGLVPKKFENAVFSSLVNNVEITAKGHFDTGMMGTPYLLEVLTKYGRTDLAYTIMNRRDFPSFGYNIEKGATTLWETWTGVDSHSHPMFGSVTAWFFQALGGINPDPNKPGFKHIIIKPNLTDALDFVKTSYPSMYGEIKSEWELTNGAFKLEVEIPPNTTASIYIPTNKKQDISVNNKDAVFKDIDKQWAHFELISGSYTFNSKNIKNLVKSPMLSIPLIYPPDSILFSPTQLTVKMRQYSKDAEIRYTLNGLEPDESANLYTSPFKIEQSAIIKAKTFRINSKPSFTKTNLIIFIDSLINGINYTYYQGVWQKLPDFSKRNAMRSGTTFRFDLNDIGILDKAFGVVYTTDIQINSEGNYTFYLGSNDGSKLLIDNLEIINFDGLHGFSYKKGLIYLSKGRHKIKLEYFQAGGGKGLELQFESSEMEKQLIPSDLLFSHH